MKKAFFLLFIIFIHSCQTNKNNSTSVMPYKTAQHYFIKNNLQINEFVEKVITNQVEFNELFGEAAFMGKGGKPTPIDFSKENVIVLIHPKTDRAVEIIPVKLEKTQTGEAICHYQVKNGEKKSFATIPKLMIIVDKNVEKVTFKKE
ncbi:hypothetical protein ACMGDK_02930 [Chryseobacterium sp. DT-3]|uniref:hypothetical protein n=1 Tax=Chryseobacterium sp. DT-3 TaxID=3396164 RepID=UPI003F1E453B